MKPTRIDNEGLAGLCKGLPMGFILAVAATFAGHDARATPIMVSLGTASNFAVLAGSGITITGPTTITGDVGTFPTPAITGFGNVSLNGVNQAGNAVTQNAQNDLTTAINSIAALAPGATYAGGADLGGQTLTAGVYNDASSLFLTGILTLDGQGNPDAFFYIKAGSTLITASDSSVLLTGGAQACHVIWLVGSSATLGTQTDFVGTILANTSITLDTGASLDGRALAANGAVTLDNNTITVPVCNTANVPDKGNTLFMLGFGLASLLGLERWISATARGHAIMG
jgi:hypothetical protein